MKIIKFIFNRFTIFSIAIIAQILFYILWALYFADTQIMWFIGALAGVIVLLNIIARNLNPAQTLLWTTAVMSFPIAGVTLYLLLGRSLWSKKTKDRMRKSFFKQAKTVNVTEDYPQKYRGQINYIIEKAKTCAYRGSETKYFESGENFFADMVKELAAAKKYIFMEYFIIERGKLWDKILPVLEKKAKSGVPVYLMYDDIGSISKLPSSYYKRLNEKGIRCVKFNKYYPVITNIHNNRDHRKITVIDGAVAYTGGLNIADEYVNEAGRSYYWKDTGVKIKGNAVGEIAEQFMQLYEIASKQELDFDSFIYDKPLISNENGIVVPFGSGPDFFYKAPVAEEIMLNMIDQSDSEIIITTPSLICDYTINRSLVRAVARGVDVKIVLPDVPDKKIIYIMTKSNAKYLRDNGVKIYRATGSFLHAKSIVSDKIAAVTGTINFDYRSFLHHFENGVWMCETNAVNELLNDVSSLCTEKNEFGKDLNMRLPARLLAGVLKIFTPLF